MRNDTDKKIEKLSQTLGLSFNETLALCVSQTSILVGSKDIDLLCSSMNGDPKVIKHRNRAIRKSAQFVSGIINNGSSTLIEAMRIVFNKIGVGPKTGNLMVSVVSHVVQNPSMETSEIMKFMMKNASAITRQPGYVIYWSGNELVIDGSARSLWKRMPDSHSLESLICEQKDLPGYQFMCQSFVFAKVPVIKSGNPSFFESCEESYLLAANKAAIDNIAGFHDKVDDMATRLIKMIDEAEHVSFINV